MYNIQICDPREDLNIFSGILQKNDIKICELRENRKVVPGILLKKVTSKIENIILFIYLIHSFGAHRTL